MIKLICFDIDGTLLDTREFIIGAYLHTIKHHAGIDYARDELITFINGTIHEVYETALPGHLQEAFLNTHEEFQTANLHLITIYDEVVTTLDILKKKNIRFAAVTNRRRESALRNLSLHKLDSYFDIVITPEDVKKGKPDPEGVIKVMKQFDVKPRETMFVGDAVSDILTGQNAQIKTVGVTHGFSTKKQLEDVHADYVIDTISQLIPLCEESESN